MKRVFFLLAFIFSSATSVFADTSQITFQLPKSGRIIGNQWDRIMPQATSNVEFVLQNILKCNEIQKPKWSVVKGDFVDRLFDSNEASMSSTANCPNSYVIVGTIQGYPKLVVLPVQYLIRVYDNTGLNILATYEFADGQLQIH